MAPIVKLYNGRAIESGLKHGVPSRFAYSEKIASASTKPKPYPVLCGLPSSGESPFGSEFNGHSVYYPANFYHVCFKNLGYLDLISPSPQSFNSEK